MELQSDFNMKVIGVAKLTSKGQITLPKEVREALKTEQGEFLFFLEDEEGFIYLTKEIEVASPQKKK